MRARRALLLTKLLAEKKFDDYVKAANVKRANRRRLANQRRAERKVSRAHGLRWLLRGAGGAGGGGGMVTTVRVTVRQ